METLKAQKVHITIIKWTLFIQWSFDIINTLTLQDEFYLAAHLALHEWIYETAFQMIFCSDNILSTITFSVMRFPSLYFHLVLHSYTRCCQMLLIFHKLFKRFSISITPDIRRHTKPYNNERYQFKSTSLTFANLIKSHGRRKWETIGTVLSWC